MKPVALGLAALALAAACSRPVVRVFADLTLDPGDAVRFQQIAVDASDRRVVTLGNRGNGELVVGALSFRDPTEEFTLAPLGDPQSPLAPCGGVPFALAPRASCAVEVRYAPVDRGADRNRLLIGSNDVDEPERGLEVVSGQVGQALRCVTGLIAGGTVDFGMVEGREGPVTVQIANAGVDPIDVAGLAIEGSDEFSFASELSSGTLAPGEAVDVELRYALDPDGSGEAQLVARPVDESVGAAVCRLLGPPVACIAAPEGIPLFQPAHLDGRCSRAPGLDVSRWRWRVAEHPEASASALAFNAGEPQTVQDAELCPAGQNAVAEPCFVADAPGDYLFELDVVDDRPNCALADPGATCRTAAGCCSFDCQDARCAPAAEDDAAALCRDGGGCAIESQEPARVTVRGVTEDGLLAVLEWDGGGDLDLHLATCDCEDPSWGASQCHAYHQNAFPDWGAPRRTEDPPTECESDEDCVKEPFTSCRGSPAACTDTSDDPRLLIDATEGPATESIVIRLPAPGRYVVGVHYLGGSSDSDQARVTLLSTLADADPLGAAALVLEPRSFWTVGTVTVPETLTGVTFAPAAIGADNPVAASSPAVVPPPCR